MKECVRCQRLLEESSFYKDRGRLIPRCKECIKDERRQKYLEHSEQVKSRASEYRKNNPEKVKQSNSRYQKSDRAKNLRKARYKKNIDKHREKDRNRWRESWESRKISKVKSMCKAKKIDFDLTVDWLKRQFEKQEFRCFYSNVLMDTEKQLFKPTLERLDPSRGYTQDNVVLATYFFNMGRNNAPIEQVYEMIKKINHGRFLYVDDIDS
jgi:hypothetical protein